MADKEKLKKRKSMSRMYSGSVDRKKKDEVEDDNKLVMPARVGYEDMTQMDDMTLDGVLNNLKDRYSADLIYVCDDEV
jgi:myosin heavy subunit